MRNFKLIVFDWDGTLYRSIDLIKNSIVAAGREVGATIGDDVAREIIGLGLKAAQKLLFPPEKIRDSRFLSEFHRAYRNHYEAGEAEILLYDGAFELVRDLHSAQRVVAVATAKSRAGIDRTMAATGLATFVAHSRTPEECRPKPDPQMLEEILAASGVAAADALMVGDTTHDLQMAANAGVAAAALTHGAHSEAALKGMNPIVVCDSISALRAALLGS